MQADNDTAIGGKSDKFPVTRISAIHSLRNGDEVGREIALNSIIAAYWKPVYKYVRIKWHKSNEDAKDLVQGFFANMVEKDFFKSYDPSKAKFRTFLRVCLDGYIQNHEKSEGRLKRGGDIQKFSLDFVGAEEELNESAPLQVTSPDTIDTYFKDECVRSVFSLSIESLRAQCQSNGKSVHFRLFELYDLGTGDDGSKPSYEILANQLAISVSDVTNYLSYARREFRSIVLDNLRELTATDEEYRQEALALLGIEPK